MRRSQWSPSATAAAQANLSTFLRWLHGARGLTFESYTELWSWSVREPHSFWDAIWNYFDILSSEKPRSISEGQMPHVRWFQEAEVNYAEHVLRSTYDDPAIISVDENDAVRELSWLELREQVGQFATYLRLVGVQPGDRVVGYMANTVETVIAFLGTAAVGAIWATCGPELGTGTVLSRMSQLEPVVMVAAAGYKYAGRYHNREPQLEAIRAALPSLKATVVVGASKAVGDRHHNSLYVEWDDVLAGASADHGNFARVPAGHPLWVVFSSGTTGAPKGIVHDHVGVLVEHYKFLSLHMDLKAGDRFFWHTSTSWMMWNIVVSGLLTGATIMLYSGSPQHPTPDRLWKFAAKYGVSVLGTSATYIMNCIRSSQHPNQLYDLSRLRALHSTGSALPASGFKWAHSHVGNGIPVVSGSGGTDVASGFVGGNPLLAVQAGEISGPCLGVDAQVWDDDGHRIVDQIGELVVVAPMPSMPVCLWGDSDFSRYRDSYFATYEGIWRHGDLAQETDRGTFILHGRSDATLNRGGVRMGAADVYSAVSSVSSVEDSLIIGIDDTDGGYWMPLFVTLRADAKLDQELTETIREAVRLRASPTHVPDEVIQVKSIPRTLTGKKLEVPVKRLLMGHPKADVVDVGAVEDPAALDFFVQLGRHRQISGRTAGERP